MSHAPLAPTRLDRTLTWRLHQLGKITDRATQAAYARDAGIAFSDGRCLAAIGAFSPLSVVELAQRAHLNKGQASRAAQSLVELGFVRKAASASDGRGVVLSLTAKGRRTWAGLMRVIEQRNADIASCLSARECAQFSQMLDRLVAHARAKPPLDGPGDDAPAVDAP